MSDHLDHLVARARASRPAIRPRLEPLYATRPSLSEIDEPDASPFRAPSRAADASPASPASPIVARAQPEPAPGTVTPQTIRPDSESQSSELAPKKKTEDAVVDAEPALPQAIPNGTGEQFTRRSVSPAMTESKIHAPFFPSVARHQRPVRTASAPTTNGHATAPAPVVRVTIGRIEVRAGSQPATPRSTPKSTAPSLTLDAYLKARKEGAR